MIVIGEHDDSCLDRLAGYLDSCGVEVVRCDLGRLDDEVEVDADLSSCRFRLRVGRGELSDGDIRRADLVLFRRCWNRAKPFVRSTEDGEDFRSFAEREWSALVEGLLLVMECMAVSTWMNRPSLAALSRNKPLLLWHARQAAFQVPATTVSTRNLAPPSRHGTVCKAINVDERISDGAYLATRRLSASTLAEYRGVRTATPSLLQEYVPHQAELRVYWVLGTVVPLRIRRHGGSGGPVDSRYVPRERLDVELVRVPPTVEERLGRLAAATGLHFFAVDFLDGGGDDLVLVDVNPNASWSFYEVGREITGAIGDGVLRWLDQHPTRLGSLR